MYAELEVIAVVVLMFHYITNSILLTCDDVYIYICIVRLNLINMFRILKTALNLLYNNNNIFRIVSDNALLIFVLYK